MRLGILKEEKRGEHRVICTPNEVRSITAAGHEVLVREGCGRAAGFPDAAYAAAGAQVVCGAKEVFARCELVAKVKEFTEEERRTEEKLYIIPLIPPGMPTRKMAKSSSR